MAADKRMRTLLTLAVAAALLFSALFIIIEADHDCAGEDCAVCAVIAVCEKTLHSVMAASVLAFAGLFMRDGVLSDLSGVSGDYRRISPVSLRVRLLD